MSVPHYIERSFRSVHQVELTSRCNLRCVYCTSPQIMKGLNPRRPALDMTREVFDRVLQWVAHFVQGGSQGAELNLAGIGESTLHPNLSEWIGLARAALGKDRRIVFATNGLTFTEDHARALVEAAPAGVWVSMHRPEKAEPAIEIAKRYGVLLAATMDPAMAPNAWAGQVQWRKPTYTLPCAWLAEGRAFVLADGRISACCLDATGDGVVGHVSMTVLPRTRTYNLCPGCHHDLSRQALDLIQATGGIVQLNARGASDA